MADKVTAKLAEIDTDLIYADYSENFRMDSAYKELKPIPNFNPEKQKPGLYEDILANGIHTPLWVAKMTDEEIATVKAKTGMNYKFIVVRGHRRFYVATAIRANQSHMFQKLKCEVYDGLSKADRYKLMADHMQTKGLNDFEVYMAVKRLALNTGLSEVQIGHQLNRSRGFVQRRKWIAQMPECVEANYRLMFTRDDEGNPVKCVKLTDEILNKLHMAFVKDEETGRDSNSPDSDFSKQWDEVAAGEAPPKIKALTRDKILDKAKMVRDPIVKEIMAVCAGDEGNLADAEDKIKALRARVKELEDLLAATDAKLEAANLELETLRGSATNQAAAG